MLPLVSPGTENKAQAYHRGSRGPVAPGVPHLPHLTTLCPSLSLTQAHWDKRLPFLPHASPLLLITCFPAHQFLSFFFLHLCAFNELPTVWLQATRTQATSTPLIFSSALLLKYVAFAMTGRFGRFCSLELCRSPIAPCQWWEWLQSCFWQHLPVSAHWPRSTVYQVDSWAKALVPL